MDRIQLINLLIERRGYKRYLEIGCFADECFNQVRAESKVGVDPVSGGTIRKTSDAFFESAIAAGEHFDIIFIDGLHHHDQVYRDVENSLMCLSEGGAILLHDCLPPDHHHEMDPVTNEITLCGTVWRAFVQFRKRLDLDAIVGDFDYGVGLIRKVQNPVPLVLNKTMDELCYEDLVANREAWMRPVGPAVFQIISAKSWKPPSIAVLVIGSSDEELDTFKNQSPHVNQEARVVYVANPKMRYGGMAAIANPFFDTATEDVVGVVHADTSFGPGALRIFAREAVDRNCVTGIVGRSVPDPNDRFSGYVWCHAGGGTVSTLDSCSIFFQRTHGFRFDGVLFDSFHCVVEDICLQAHLEKIPAFVPAAQANHKGKSDAGPWMDQFWKYRERLVAKYPGVVFYTV
jgi:hypothetical protein